MSVSDLEEQRRSHDDPPHRKRLCASSRRTRRALIATQVVLVVVTASASLLGGAAVLLAVASLLTATVVQVPLRRSIQDMAERPSDVLDERMDAVRNSAFRRSYRATMPAIVVVALAAYLGIEYGGVIITAAQALAVLWVGVLVLPGLPTWLIAWNEPDD